MKLELAQGLQDLSLQNDFFTTWRSELVEAVHKSITRLNRNNFAVRQHLQVLDRFKSIEAFRQITESDVYALSTEVAPLVLPEQDDFEALRFDSLVYGIELAKLRGTACKKAYKDLVKRVEGLTSCGNIPEVLAQKELIEQISHIDYLTHAELPDLENIRTKLRSLMRFVPLTTRTRYETNFKDCVTGYNENIFHPDSVELENYRKKAEHFLRENKHLPSIAKLTTNEPLSKQDIKELEGILWNQLGTKDNYKHDVGDVPLGEFVRATLGLDIQSINKAFSKFIDEHNLNSNQIYFVNRIKEYIAQNGVLKDMSILQRTPFTDQGSVVDLFPNLHVWNSVYSAIQSINANAHW